jgi:hypothetical protein
MYRVSRMGHLGRKGRNGLAVEVARSYRPTVSTTYAVMELLDGDTLRGLLASGALPQRKAVD